MEQSRVREIVEELRQDRADAISAAESAARRVRAIENIISGYTDLYPDLADSVSRVVLPPRVASATDAVTHSPEERPQGQDAILKVMESIEWRGRYWTVNGMVEELALRGWLPSVENPSMAVRSAMSRASASNPSVVKGRGDHGLVYYYQAAGAEPPKFRGGKEERHDAGQEILSDQLSVSGIASDGAQAEALPAVRTLRPGQDLYQGVAVG